VAAIRFPKKEMLANLSHLPVEAIELIRGVLRSEHYLAASQALVISNCAPSTTASRSSSGRTSSCTVSAHYPAWHPR
jgi:hypothetical protein